MVKIFVCNSVEIPGKSYLHVSMRTNVIVGNNTGELEPLWSHDHKDLQCPGVAQEEAEEGEELRARGETENGRDIPVK